MFTFITLSVFLFAVAISQGQMDDDPECRPPPPPNKEGECCATPGHFLGGKEKEMPEVMKTCADEAGLKPPGPPGSGTPPTAEERAAHKMAHECADECVFKSANLLTSAGELDKDAIKALVTKLFTGDWASVATTSIDKCVASAKGEVEASSKCKSGAFQVTRCFMRSMFLGCPASSWTESTECAAAKARLTKCPKAPAPMPHKK